MYTKSGIYLIHHLPSNSVYVGRSSNIFRRWSQHYDALMKGKHHCKHLQAIWEDTADFVFEIYKSCPPEQLVEMERVAESELREHHNLFNITFREDFRPGAILTVEQVREIKLLLADHNPVRELSERFGVSYGTIHSIKQGNTWVDVSV